MCFGVFFLCSVFVSDGVAVVMFEYLSFLGFAGFIMLFPSNIRRI